MKEVLLAVLASLRADSDRGSPSNSRFSPYATNSPSTSGALSERAPRPPIDCYGRGSLGLGPAGGTFWSSSNGAPVIAWQRRRFRDHWARLAQGGPGRPAVARAVQVLIRNMSSANPRWGSPRIVGELAKLGSHVAKSTVEKYMVRPKRPSSPTWRAFLDNHVKDLLSIDFFVVPTVTFKVLFVFIVLVHARRRIVHFNVTEHPTAQWAAQQISEAFPWEAAPRYLIRDRDRIDGPAFRTRVECMGIEEVLTAPRSPWQNSFAERVIGSIRRECLDHVIVLDEQHLRRLLGDYFEHYHRWRCHRSLAMDCPEPRTVQGPEQGDVVEVAEAGGLYRHCERRALG